MAANHGNIGLFAEQRGDMALAIEYWRRANAPYKEIVARPSQDRFGGWLRAAGIDPEAK